MRINWIDNVRGLGIILIVLGHCFFPDGSLIVQYVFSFHVALFFFISGYLFNDIKHTNFIKFIKNKFTRLIIPFFFFNLITFGFYKSKELLGGSAYHIDFDSFFKGIFYADYLPFHEEFLLANIPTWFLVSLFMVCIYYFFINKFIKNRYYRILVLFIISILIYVESKYIVFRLPWNAEISLMATLFYGLGHSFKNEITSFIETIDYKYLLLLPLLVGFNIYFMNGTNFAANYYGNSYILFLLDGFFGILTFLIISKLIKDNFILTFLGQNSIIIFGFEWIKFIVLSFIIFISFNTLIFEKSYLNAFIQLIGTLIVLIPLIFIINKYIPFIVGNFKNK